MKLLILSRTKLSEQRLQEALDLHRQSDGELQYVNLYPWLKIAEVIDELHKFLPGERPVVYLPSTEDVKVNPSSLWLKTVNHMIDGFYNRDPEAVLANQLQSYIALQLREGAGHWSTLGNFITRNNIVFDYVSVHGNPSFVEMLYLNAFKPEVKTGARIGNIVISKGSGNVAVSFKVDGQHDIEVITAYREVIHALQHVRSAFQYLATTA